MSNHPDHFRPQSTLGSDQYLEAAIRTASPARLRLMMIERGIEVAERLAHLWREKLAESENEHSLKLLEILNELLSGVTRGTSESEKSVCRQVADLYVFLTQHLIAAEASCDAMAVEEIRLVLLAEAETWRAVCASEGNQSVAVAGKSSISRDQASSAMVSESLNFEA